MPPLPSGWDAAKNWQRLKQTVPSGHIRRRVQDSAIAAILERARALLRHAARPVGLVEEPWPAEGDLDLERSLEHSALFSSPYASPDDLRVTRNEPREVEVVAMLDMSLSMTGEKVALLAVAAAILRIKLDCLAVVSFDSKATRLVDVGERVSLREMVRRIMEVPTQGYTNIEAGLFDGLLALRRSQKRERVGLLLTDGVANMGGDPRRAAGRFPRLHVVHLGDHHPQGARACREMATAGRGTVYRARIWADLPGVVRRAVRELFRG